jgi:hypothetical protein
MIDLPTVCPDRMPLCAGAVKAGAAELRDLTGRAPFSKAAA